MPQHPQTLFNFPLCMLLTAMQKCCIAEQLARDWTGMLRMVYYSAADQNRATKFYLHDKQMLYMFL